MKTYYYALALLIVFAQNIYSQTGKVNHWEVVMHPEYKTTYFVGNQAPDENWNTSNFDNSNWEESNMAVIGYGGIYDTLVKYNGFPDLNFGPVTSFYTRSKFNIVDSSAIEQLQLNIYYADGFVAYLNGVEIARQNIGAANSEVSFNQTADTTQFNQADIYWGFYPPGIIINKDKLKTALRTGENTIAVEIHNDAYETYDHNYFMWIMAGLNVEEKQYEYMDPSLPISVSIDSSNLPIVMINTALGKIIPDEPKIMAKMKVSFDSTASFNMVSPTNYHFHGDIGIELRGSSSKYNYPKKSYGFETRTNNGDNLDTALLGMPKENDWILYAPYGDKTLIRNVLTYRISNDLGMYAPRTQFVELTLNDNLLGTYVLMEKIKRDKKRVNVSKLRPDEISGNDLTGGYIIKIDKKEGKFDGWHSEYGSAEKESYRTFFQYVYPKYDEIVDQQKTYIQNFMKGFEESLRLENFEDPITGYRKYIDMESFIQYFIMNELTKNMDGYRLSTFMYKDRDDKGGKLHMGPVWDYNLAFGNYVSFTGHETDSWALDFGNIKPSDQYQLPFWWDRLLQDADFVNELKLYWDQKRETTLSKNHIFAAIDEMTKYTEQARNRNFSVWQETFNVPIWPNNPLADDYDGEITYLKNWISDRLEWIDANIGEVREKKTYVSIDNEKFNEYLAINTYPNPFSYEINIELNLESTRNIDIMVYNTIGQKINHITNTRLDRGNHIFTWQGQKQNGEIVEPGVYIYTIVIDGNKTYTGKIIKQ